jgi:hypothetical protein
MKGHGKDVWPRWYLELFSKAEQCDITNLNEIYHLWQRNRVAVAVRRVRKKGAYLQQYIGLRKQGYFPLFLIFPRTFNGNFYMRKFNNENLTMKKTKGHWFCDHCDDIIFMSYQKPDMTNVFCPVCGRLSCHFVPTQLTRKMLGEKFFKALRDSIDAQTTPDLAIGSREQFLGNIAKNKNESETHE